MDSFELPVVTERSHKSRSENGELIIIPLVDYFLNVLVAHSPAELFATYSPDNKEAVWSVISIPDEKVVHSESIPCGLFRPCLARIAVTYMGGCVYGGFNRLNLIQSEKIIPAAFYLGTDGLCGFWFRGKCVPAERDGPKFAKQKI